MKSLLADAVVLAAITAVAMKLTHGVRTWMDLALVDETGYLQLGVSIPQEGLPHASWGVLYSVWYFVLSLVSPDRVSLQFLGFRLLVLLMAIASYLALRRIGTSPGLAAIVSFLFLLSGSPFPDPRPMHLAVVVLFVFAILAGSIRGRLPATALLVLGLLFASLARTEFFPGFLVMAGVFSITVVRRIVRNERRREALWVAGGVAVVAIIVIAAFGSPIGPGRSGEAFGQHFALNYVQRTGAPLNPWTDTDLIIEEVFGEIDGIGSALVANPAAFGRHVSQNLAHYARRSLELAAPRPRPLPALLTDGLRWAVAACYLVGLIVVPVLLYRRGARRKLAADDDGLTLFVLYVGIAVSVVLAASVVIYPRDHYLVGQGLFVGAFIAVGLSRWIGSDGKAGRIFRSPWWALGLGIAVLLLTPNRAAIVTDQLRASPRHQPSLKTVEAVRALGYTNDVRILHDVGILAFYLGDDAVDVNQYSKPRDQGFFEFREESGVNMILVQESLLADTRFRDDPEWRALISDPGRHGFRRIRIANTRRYLLVDRQLEGSQGERSSR